MRPKSLRLAERGGALLVLLALVLGTLGGCASGPLLSNVVLSSAVIAPNGADPNSVGFINYAVSRESLVTITFKDAAGQEFVFRSSQPRAPGQYEARFNGTYTPDESKPDRRVLPNGTYVVTVRAQTTTGESAHVERALEVRDADNQPPHVSDVSLLPETFSPNGDNLDDEMLINYTLSKDAWVTVLVVAPDGVSYLLDPETAKNPRLYSLRWNGTAGDRLLNDGTYVVHIRTRDTAGNVTNVAHPVHLQGAGRPRLEITGVKFSPLGVPVGGVLNVEIRAKNTGDAPLQSLGPDSGTPYDTTENFNKFQDAKGRPIYFERPGVWRIGVDWEQSSRPYPVRWGWGDRKLLPGEEATVTGTIEIGAFNTPYVRFWAGVVQEGIGFPGGQVGHQVIAISY